MITLLVALVLGCVALGVIRFVRGPADADRIIALDILFSAAVAFCALAALATRRVLFLDIAIGVVLIGFVATLAWARLVEMRRTFRCGAQTMTIAGILLLFLGALVLLLASAGLFVLQDALSRQHAATKAGSLGIVFIVAGTALLGGDWSWGWRALVIILIVWLTLPVASHVLARAAIRENLQMENDSAGRKKLIG